MKSEDEVEERGAVSEAVVSWIREPDGFDYAFFATTILAIGVAVWLLLQTHNLWIALVASYAVLFLLFLARWVVER